VISVIAIIALVSGVLLGSMLQFSHIQELRNVVTSLQERNDRLVEAISQSKSGAPVVMPRQPVELEASAGWWDTKPPLA
jgi:type II secretory pathway pseudopilin PulG